MVRWRVVLLALVLLLALGQTVLADGGREARLVFGQNLTLHSGEEAGDVVVFGGHATLDPGAIVRGDLVVFGGDAVVSGSVNGNIAVFGGVVELRETAVVGGDVHATETVRRAAGARVGGSVSDWGRGGWNWGGGPRVFVPRGHALNFHRPLISTVQTVLSALMLLVLGVIVVLLAPNATRTVSQCLLAAPLHSGGLGLAVAVLFPVAAVLLAVTIVGIPALVLLAIGLAVAGIFGWVAVALTLGDKLMQAVKQEQTAIVSVSVGIVALVLLSAMPCLGGIVWSVAGVWGLGAVILTRFGSRGYQPPAAAPQAPAPTEPQPPAPTPEPGAAA
ncbi:MAG: hypothetical protein ACUVX9_11250 [Anaerolineae bacterium]